MLKTVGLALLKVNDWIPWSICFRLQHMSSLMWGHGSLNRLHMLCFNWAQRHEGVLRVEV
jgi:hypothetical protein